jgi:exodeoxyribonuclease VII large subunit
LRAPTPSAAAELIVPDIIDLRRRIEVFERALTREQLNRMHDALQRLDLARESLRRHIVHKIDNCKRALIQIARTIQAHSPLRELMLRRNRCVDLRRRLAELPRRVLENARHRFRETEGILRVLGPDATLRRGYTITTDERGKLVRTVSVVRPKMKIRTRVSDGEFGSEVL